VVNCKSFFFLFGKEIHARPHILFWVSKHQRLEELNGEQERMGKKSKSVLGDRVEKEEVLTVLLAQAVGSDGSALQAWTIQALEKKRDGDG
jgi:hypothetical protein